MKKTIMIFGLVLALTATMAFSAGATMISGTISFAGGAILDDSDLTLADKFEAMGPSFITGVSGDYVGIAPGTIITVTPFTFDPLPAAGIVPLWTLAVGPVTYIFDATTIGIDFRSSTQIDFGGIGTARITGFEDTPGTWTITANSSTAGGGTTFSYSAGSTASPVPEPATMFLLGFGLIGLAGYSRKRAKK